MNKKVKKVLAAALAMVCCASFATTAFAELDTDTRLRYENKVNSYLKDTWKVTDAMGILTQLSDGVLEDYKNKMEEKKGQAVMAYEVVETSLERGDPIEFIEIMLNMMGEENFGVTGALETARIDSDNQCLEIVGTLRPAAGGNSVKISAYPGYPYTAPTTFKVSQGQEPAAALADNTATTALTRSETAVIK